MSNPIIYTLSCRLDDDQTVKYVGKSTTPNRMWEHKRLALNGGESPLSAWIRNHIECVQMRVIDTLPPDATDVELEVAEARWIRYYRALGYPLKNRTVSSLGKPDPHRPPQPITPPYFSRKDS